jgi:hypothetical protein
MNAAESIPDIGIPIKDEKREILTLPQRSRGVALAAAGAMTGLWKRVSRYEISCARSEWMKDEPDPLCKMYWSVVGCRCVLVPFIN